MFSASIPWKTTTKGTSANAVKTADGRLVTLSNADRKQADLTVNARVIIRTAGCGVVPQRFDEDDCVVVVRPEALSCH